ncbi:hypothetical protein GOP47_0010885 [Adiantum capillus-veneris]|uniref:Protein kinase domain-containing protein n=1 Tax=Adiantum capillus-veneris TaxID=13818 RepID=A0A9D4UW37_ADICA|nr:hypothetical protein GOP47_0010885 [Adiantum capillus-veneris]
MSCSFGRQLGHGVDGVVRLCTDISSGQQYACKSVSKNNPDAVRHIHTEISILQKLQGHPNIISFHGHFEDEECIHMLMEMCEGGNLSEYLQQKGPLPEVEAALAMATIIQAVLFCHERGIMHRDLKLDNILLPHKIYSYMELKLADFGTAADFSRCRIFEEAEGTPWYLAPELLAGSYDEKVDVWSLGVLLHILLCGYPPFDGESASEIFEAIRKGKLDLKGDPWPSISAEAKSLVKGMLQRNPFRRIKLRELSTHPWMQRFVVAGKETWANSQVLSTVVVGG